MTRRSRRHTLWKVLALCSCVCVLLLSSLIPQDIAYSKADGHTVNIEIASPNRRIAQDTVSEEGAIAFQSGRFAAAISAWQTALASPAAADPLTRAYLLSSLTAAHLNLSQLNAAQETLAQSLISLNSAEQSAAYAAVAARVFNAQGQVQWQQGQAEQALQTWQEAEAQYRKAEEATAQNSVGIVVSQINQAIALQELGFSARAASQLTQLAPELTALPPQLRTAAAINLAKALRGVGELSNAQKILDEQLDRPADSKPTNATQQAQLQMERGHTLRMKSHQAIAIGQNAIARSYAMQTTAAYKSAAQLSTSPLLQTQAQLNQVSYLIETGALNQASDLLTTQFRSISPSELPLGRAAVEARISYAHTLACLNAPASYLCVQQAWQDQSAQSVSIPAETDWQREVQILRAALAQAAQLQDTALISYALGELGHVYELAGQYDDAITLSQRALQTLETIDAPEIAYRWEWQLGRLYQLASSNNRLRAVSAYQQALKSLAAVRQNLLLVDPQIQFSFRDNVEPVYREFVSLLLDTPLVKQENLKLAVQTLDALQLTELENFLGCNLSQLVSLNKSAISSSKDSSAIKIYPIILPDQLAIIYEVPGQPLGLLRVPVSQREIESTLISLRQNLTIPGKTPAVLSDSAQVYEWLIRPLESILADNKQIETLVFVPDGLLRNIPFSVLYDGEQYLIEKDYGITIAPQLDLFAPRKTAQQLRVLRGGIELSQTIRGQQFPSIELVRTELEQIPEALAIAPPLLNESFTQANIEQQLASKRYSAIHWKTHGVFSSAPAETFLVAYQDGITADELSQLVQSASVQQKEPLELLVLSACETAQGDSRAVLGLAGIAVRAGTRSTLSTLWRADDGANTQLMSVFYQELERGLSKAQALQKAQQTLLSDAGYPAPYYWASYVLVGNWL